MSEPNKDRLAYAIIGSAVILLAITAPMAILVGLIGGALSWAVWRLMDIASRL